MKGNRESTICARFSHCKSLQKLQPNRSDELSAGLAATYPPVVDADEWPASVQAPCRPRWLPPPRSHQAGVRGNAPAACCGEGERSSLDGLLLPLLLLPGPLQINPRDPVAQSPCREDQLLAGAAVFDRAAQGCIPLEFLDQSLQF